MLLALIPSSNIDLTIIKLILTLTLEFIIAKLAYILNAIWPRELAKSLHLAVFPLALIAFAIGPVVGTSAFNHTFFELTGVPRPIS